MKLGNWQLPQEWRARVRQFREQLESARSQLTAQVPRLQSEPDGAH
jgi:hypothetical protein